MILGILTLGIMTLSIMTLGILIHDIPTLNISFECCSNGAMLSVTLFIVMLSVNAECCSSYCDAQCHNAECCLSYCDAEFIYKVSRFYCFAEHQYA
jgi:hypothetical protein